MKDVQVNGVPIARHLTGCITEIERFFKTGDGSLDLVETYASAELAVLVAVERQSGEVGDYPAQDWSLRVTLVFRREGGGSPKIERSPKCERGRRVELVPPTRSLSTRDPAATCTRPSWWYVRFTPSSS
jgi:hypothetical protein